MNFFPAGQNCRRSQILNEKGRIDHRDKALKERYYFGNPARAAETGAMAQATGNPPPASSRRKQAIAGESAKHD
ncbi:hypothetical protein [Ensifer adhaerens]|uniref:hypothetical protein n=1 Tax=Ensifer adhaerens TaxID=106592 RepID=UPI00117856DA|nr:hypothetical protein [Ensifer adhaerens]